MYSKLPKTIGIFIFLTLTSLVSPTLIKAACTYNSTITGNHADFQITSDVNNIQIVQLMHVNDQPNAPYTITALYAPSLHPWTQYVDGQQTYSGYSMVIQYRKQPADAAYWIGWIDSLNYNIIPPGLYGLDFTGSMTDNDLSLEYGTQDSDGNYNVTGNDWSFCTRTGDVDYSTPAPTPTPSPTPSSTPSFSPSPTTVPSPTVAPVPTPSPSPTLQPVTKVVLVPGMGASWNVDAFMNCKNSGYNGGWTLAPYAKEVYKEVTDQLNSHLWTVLPFYYDWRADVRTNTPKLTTLINSNTSSGEKVNLLGHSMGGLIGRNYLETQNGGKALKFLAVGSPFQGAALAYPALVDGQVWTDDLTEKIATTLMFNRCGTATSFKNILPTYNYLRDAKTNVLKNVNSMKTKNNYLPTNFVAPFWGVKVGTLAGTSKSTLKIIDVIKDSKWPDGKPIGKEYSNDGDGTVLTSSVQIPGAFSNNIINESHTGIIASTNGVSKILEFFGSPGITDPPYYDSKSALVIVGYPGTFWLTDKNGHVTQSEQGMISILNPESGDYQLQIVPQSVTTDFIVAQFLPNGKTFYKDYKFKGLVIEPKVIHFDSKRPEEDCVHNARDFKKPNFPKFWRFFWDFWNNHH